MSSKAAVGDQNSTWIIELVVVVLAVMVGVVFVANRWPGPDLPVIVAGAGTVLYVAYAVGSHVLAARSGKADAASAGASSGQQLSAQQQASQQPVPQQPVPQQPVSQQPARNQQTPQQPMSQQPTPQQPTPQQPMQQPAGNQQTPNQPAQPLNPAAFQAPKPAASSVEVGAASEGPTSLHELEELRPETDADLTTSPGQSVPEFAESTMQVSHERLADGARKLREQEQAQAEQQNRRPSRRQKAPAQPNPDEEKTDLKSLRRLQNPADSREESQ